MEPLSREERGRSAAEATQRWAAAPEIRLREVKKVEIDPTMARVGVDASDRLVVATTPGESEDDRRGPRRRRALGLPEVATTDHSVLNVMIVDDEGDADSILIRDVPVPGASAETMPDGDLLVVSPRARWTESGGEHNVWIVAPDGTPRHSFCAGDGILRVGTTPSGRIWTGYFDEGTLGNSGWGSSDGRPPLGRSGLVCWSQRGERLYEFTPPEGFAPILDCYAMCVDGEDAWTCYMGDFDLVRIDGQFRARGWKLGASRAQAVAVGAGRAAVASLLAGSDLGISIVDLAPNATGDRMRARLVMPNGSELPRRYRIVGRGQYIHLITADLWLRIDIDDLPSS